VVAQILLEQRLYDNDLAWVKFAALAEGARLATGELWN